MVEGRPSSQYDDIYVYLKALVDNGDIEDNDVVGITRYAIDNGIDALSVKQKYVFENRVLKEFPQPTCEHCGDLIPYENAYAHIHEPGFCDSCQHSYERMVQNNP